MKTASFGFYQNASSQDYSFFTLLDDLVDGDAVVAEVGAGELKVVFFRGYHADINPRATKWAFQKVDVAHLDELKEALEKSKELEAKRRTIIKKLEGKLQDSNRIEKYRELAKTDQEASDLLKELDALNIKILK